MQSLTISSMDPGAVLGCPVSRFAPPATILHALDVFSGAFQPQELPGAWCSEIQAGSKGEVGVHILLWLGR